MRVEHDRDAIRSVGFFRHRVFCCCRTWHRQALHKSGILERVKNWYGNFRCQIIINTKTILRIGLPAAAGPREFERDSHALGGVGFIRDRYHLLPVLGVRVKILGSRG